MEDGCLGNIIMTNLAVAFRTHNIFTFSYLILRTSKRELDIINENIYAKHKYFICLF